MEKRTSVFARIFAILALAAAIAAVFLIVSGAVEDTDKKSGNKSHQQVQHKEKEPRTKAASYEVKPGDTLTSISAQTGVPVTELKELNPEVDPQILVEGEKLKLR